MNYYRWLDKQAGRLKVPEGFFLRGVLKTCAFYYDQLHPPKKPTTDTKK